MSKKILLGVLVILVLSIPAASAQEITKSYDSTFECPVNGTVLIGIYFYNNTDYAFDNFTFSYVDISILSISTAYLLITIYEQVAGSDFNISWYPIFTGVTNCARLDAYDLGLDDEVFNATTHPYWSRSSTQEINGTTYSVVMPFYLIRIENVDSVDAVILFDYTIAVETHGDRENVATITPRNSTGYLTPPSWVDLNPYDSGYYIDAEDLPIFIGVLLGLGGCIGALIVLIPKPER